MDTTDFYQAIPIANLAGWTINQDGSFEKTVTDETEMSVLPTVMGNVFFADGDQKGLVYEYAEGQSLSFEYQTAINLTDIYKETARLQPDNVGFTNAVNFG